MIRRYRPADRPELYAICVRTGASGVDATDRIERPDLLGDVFVGPYLALEPGLAFVVDRGAGPEGYVLGTGDSAAFAARCERSWWPALRARYRGISGDPALMDPWLLSWIRKPPDVPALAAEYPGHAHIDLDPGLQGGGFGRLLIERLIAELTARGCPGMHLGVGRANTRAIGFYSHLGFTELDADERTIWLGMRFDGQVPNDVSRETSTR